MKKERTKRTTKPKQDEDTMRPEYDFSKAERGVTATRYARGTNIADSTEPRIRDVKVTSDTIIAYLVDGRVISVPLVWSWRLSEATASQRARFELIGDGQGVHWPDLDEDISVEGMLHGVPAHRSNTLGHFKSRGRSRV